ncbi:MAG TPA: hypothetical protein PLK06_03870 [bacterium]|nr:hypothetical protein [bacterium]
MPTFLKHKKHALILVGTCVIAAIVFALTITAYAGPDSPKVFTQVIRSLFTETSSVATADEGDQLTDPTIDVSETEVIPEEPQPEAITPELIDSVIPSDAAGNIDTPQIDTPAVEIIDTPVINDLPGIIDVPAEVIEPEPIIEEVVPNPYAEVRSTLESVIPKFDWLYTLRSGADYDGMSNLRVTSQTSLTNVIELMEGGGNNSSIQNALCAANTNIDGLRASLAIHSDDTQPELDTDNEHILTEIETAIGSVISIWQQNAGLSIQCGS